MPTATDLIINPNAGRLRRAPETLAALRRIAHRHTRVWETRSLQELEAACGIIAKDGTDRVVVCGGDGTIMACVTALSRALGSRPHPEFAFLAAGTVCTTASQFARTDSIPDRARRLIESPNQPTVRHPTLKVIERRRPPRIGFTFGTGLVLRFFERYQAAGASGRGCALRILLRVLLGSLAGTRYARGVLEPVPCRVRVDDTMLAQEAFSLVVASVLRNLGLSMRVTYRAAEDPMRFHFVTSSLPPRKLGPRAWRAALGLPLGGENDFDGLVERAELGFPSAGGYVLDGECFAATEVSVEPGPELDIVSD